MAEFLWEIGSPDPEKIQRLITEAGVTRPVAMALADRGILPEAVATYLRPTLANLADPYTLPGALEAAKRLWQAVRNGERILIHGDYDTDGITASALMNWVLKENGAEVTVFLPHRIDDGYGLTLESIQKACTEGYSLVVTVDCGITCHEAVALAVSKGLDVVITDHHMPGPEIMTGPVAVVDPKLPGSPESLNGLAGVGVAFKVCHAFLKYGREMEFCGNETDLKEVLDLVALGTVADIVPLSHENRILVRHGLRILSEKRRPGIHALCEIANVRSPVQTQDITYRLAPRINAPGRMGDPGESFLLLQAESMSDALSLSRRLEEYNRLRQQKEEEAIAEAEKQLTERYPNLDSLRTIVVWNPTWHQGILGILASRLARKYNRPSIVLATDASGILNGSGRSVMDIDIVEVLGRCGNRLDRFGGHAMAAGLSMKPDQFEPFCLEFETAMAGMLAGTSVRPRLKILGDMMFAEMTPQFFNEFELLEPFGHDSPAPVYITNGVRVLRTDPMGGGHSRGLLQDRSGTVFPFIAFNTPPERIPAEIRSLVYAPHMNVFAGKVTPQVKIIDLEA
jgi:single-stranded-DNA-specific exonuclease